MYMHFNKPNWRTIFREFREWIKGRYIPWNSLLKQIKTTRTISIILFVLLIGTIVSSSLLNSLLLNDLSNVSEYTNLTWIDINENNYSSLLGSQHINQDILFVFAFYVLSIKLFFTLLILISILYLFKFRQGYSIYLRSKNYETDYRYVPYLFKDSLNIALVPFPIKIYKALSEWELPDYKPSITWESLINTIFSKEPFPRIEKNIPLVKVDNLSFMYHSSNFIDRFFHYLLKKLWPSKYNDHLIAHNTLKKFEKWGKSDPRVLKGVNLRISSGKFTTILGCNGSSKSVFLKTLIFLLERYTGKITWITADLKKLSIKNFYKNVSYVDQNNIIQSDITVYDYVACGLFPSFKFFKFYYPKNDPLILENLEKMEILKHKDKNINDLSGGEKQKVILARVLTQKTPVIILDEPTTYLDINAQYKILSLLKKLQLEENKTIITVLHDLKQAEQFSDEIILMNEGNVYCYGSTKEVLNKENIEAVFGVSWK